MKFLFIALLAMVLPILFAAWRQQRARALATRRNLALHVSLARVSTQPQPEEAEALQSENWLSVQMYRAALPYGPVVVGFPLLTLALFAVGVTALPLAALGFAAVIYLVAAMMVVKWRIQSRHARLQQAMPVFLDRLRQHMLVGASVPQALQRAVIVSPPIIRWVFEPVERRVNAGGDLNETLEWAARRHGGAELAALVASVSASLRFGGRLSESLGNLSLMERRREQVQQELRSATAEVRAGSLILAALPLGVAVWLAFVTPSFIAYFFDPARGLPVFYVVAALYLTGLVLLRQIAQLRF